MLKRKNIVLTFLFTTLVALVCLCFGSGMMTANAASYSDSGKYKFDLNVGMSIMSGGNPTGYYQVYISGNSSSSSTTTISEGSILKFSPKKLEIVIPKGSANSYHQFYGRVYDVKISGPVSFSSPNINNGSTSSQKTLTYNLSGLTDGTYTFTFTKDEYYYSSTIGGTHSDYRNKATTSFSFKVDTSAPVITGASTSETGKYTNKAFTVGATDSGSGVKTLYMKAPNSGSYVNVGTSKTVSAGSVNGLYRFYAVDNAGYQSSTYYVYYDNVAPTLKAVSDSGASISSGEKTKESFSVIATDGGSGISALKYKTPSSSMWQNYTSGATINVKGEQGTYTFQATDLSGNITNFTVVLDNPCAAGHDYQSKIIAPTCTSGGYTVYTCSVCGESYTGDNTAALGHSYQASTTTGSCTSGGYTTYTCSRCGDSYTGNPTEPTGHSFSASVTEPTCTSGGFTTYTCTKCGYSYTGNETEAIGHSYEATTSPSSCTEAGYTTYKCTRCGVSYTDSPSQATGHSYVASIVEATCTERGYTTYTCSKCGDNYRDNETAPLGHNYMTEVISPTCTEKGETIYTCTRCGTSYKGSETEPSGHSFVTESVAATCEEGGYTLHTCSKCGQMYKDNIIQPLGHNFVTVTKEATCTEHGKIVYTCQICGYERTVENGVYPTGHNYANYIVKVATCTEDGERRYVCDKCGDEYTEVILAPGHSYAITDSYSENGKTTRVYTCTVCGDTYVQEMGDQYEEVSSYVEELFEQYRPYMIWVFLGTTAIWSIVMGVFFAIAQKNEEKEKAKKMIVNYVIGLVVIFAILVACPFLVRGIAVLVT